LEWEIDWEHVLKTKPQSRLQKYRLTPTGKTLAVAMRHQSQKMILLSMISLNKGFSLVTSHPLLFTAADSLLPLHHAVAAQRGGGSLLHVYHSTISPQQYTIYFPLSTFFNFFPLPTQACPVIMHGLFPKA
jgi:hypothetical protein